MRIQHSTIFIKDTRTCGRILTTHTRVKATLSMYYFDVVFTLVQVYNCILTTYNFYHCDRPYETVLKNKHRVKACEGPTLSPATWQYRPPRATYNTIV